MNTEVRKKALRALSKEELIDYIIELKAEKLLHPCYIYSSPYLLPPYTVTCSQSCGIEDSIH